MQESFLKGRLCNNEELYIKVPKGSKKHNGKDVILKLKRTINGLEQAAVAVWKELLTIFKRNMTDLCLYLSWDEG